MVNFLEDLLAVEEQIEVPAGASFGALSLIGKWVAEAYYKFMDNYDFDQDEYEWDFRTQTSSGDYWYYFKSRTAANLAYAETGDDRSPTQTWRWVGSLDSILNFAGGDIKEFFKSDVRREVRVRTYRSGKYRHELHMISLPAAVAAMADALGYDNPGFDLSELLRPTEQVLWTDDFQRDIVGNADVGYAYSLLWKRRAELWAALGEPDPQKWQLEGTGTSWDTKSEKLNKCLTILHRPWPGPMWGRVAFANDPRVDAIWNDKRLTLPCLAKIFKGGEAEARKTAEAEMAEAGREIPATKPVAGEPTLPSAWEGLHDEWIDQMAALKAEFGGELPPLPRIAGRLKDELAVTYDDVKAWWGAI